MAAGELEDAASRLSLELVLTAHPTEATRRTVLASHLRLSRLLGEFDTFAAAFYHSCVNFVTLGYGDIVMSERWRLLGPLEGANGILMFGISTAVMTAAVFDVLKGMGPRISARDAGKD